MSVETGNDVPADDAAPADLDRFRRLAAGSAVLSVPLAYLTVALLMLSIDGDPEVFVDPGRLVAIGVEGAALFRLSQLADMVGFYLLWIPPMVFLWHWLRPQAPLTVTLVTVVGVAFAFVAALGAAVNAALLPELMVEYAGAGAAERETIATLFAGFSSAIVVGLFATFARLLLSLWLFGVGYYLRREHRTLGYGAIAFGGFTTLSFLGTVAGVPTLQTVGLSGYIFLGPLWMLGLGVVLWRRPVGADATAWVDPAPTATAEW